MSLSSTLGGPGVELTAFALVGLLGGAHCIGMCGPVATMYAERLEASDGPTRFRDRARQQGLFNLGRTAGYAVMGFGFGALGTVFYDVAAISRYGTLVRAVVGVLTGAFIVGVGTYRAAGRMGSVLDAVPGAGTHRATLGTVHRRVTRRVETLVATPRIFGLGMAHGLLPCPLLFPAFLYVFARGAPVRGALALAVLGLATIPAMFLYGTAVGSVTARSRTALHRALGAAFVFLGYVPLSHGLSLLGVDVPRVPLPVYQPLVGP